MAVAQVGLLIAGAAGVGDPPYAAENAQHAAPSETVVAVLPPTATPTRQISTPTPQATPFAVERARADKRLPLEGDGALYFESLAVAATPVPAEVAAAEEQLPPQLPRPDAPPTVEEQPEPVATAAVEPAVEPTPQTVNAPFLSNLPSAEGRNVRFPEPVERWRPLIEPIAREAGIEPAMVLAVIQQESGGDPNAVSPAGAVGLMQVMPSTFQAYVPNGDIFDPRQNAFAGIYYLRDSLWYHRGDHAWALAGYNSGITGSLRMRAEGGIPWDFAGGETIRYIYAIWWHYYRALTAE